MFKLDRPLDGTRDRWFLGTLDSIVAKSSETNGAYGVIVRIAPRGFSPPNHQHEREETGFLVLDGRVTLRVGEEEHVLGPHEFRLAPRGVPHWFRVESEMARFLEIVSPGGFEGFHMEMSDAAERFELPPPDFRKPSADAVRDASSHYGTTLLGGVAEVLKRREP